MTNNETLNWEFIRIWLKQNLHIRMLHRDGKTVFYVHPVGGEYRELKPFETP
jgi:hypothetical protein